MNTRIIAIIFTIVVLIGLVYLISQKQDAVARINSFDECVAAGYPVMESFPPRCSTPDGRSFMGATTSESVLPGATSTPFTKTCHPTGCSGQVCSDEDIATDCQYKEEYTCYKQATCERQVSGECGWTESATLKSCLQAHRN
jgi:hypothetical protein